jgi:hypothetical protein
MLPYGRRVTQMCRGFKEKPVDQCEWRTVTNRAMANTLSTNWQSLVKCCKKKKNAVEEFLAKKFS